MSYFSIRLPMPEPWGPPPMMYPPCPPWGGVVRYVDSAVHFYPIWSGPAEGFDHRSYYTEDDRYGSVSHQQDRKDPRQ
jgi:hypothetical protein